MKHLIYIVLLIIACKPSDSSDSSRSDDSSSIDRLPETPISTQMRIEELSSYFNALELERTSENSVNGPAIAISKVNKLSSLLDEVDDALFNENSKETKRIINEFSDILDLRTKTLNVELEENNKFELNRELESSKKIPSFNKDEEIATALLNNMITIKHNEITKKEDIEVYRRLNYLKDNAIRIDKLTMHKNEFIKSYKGVIHDLHYNKISKNFETKISNMNTKNLEMIEEMEHYSLIKESDGYAKMLEHLRCIVNCKIRRPRLNTLHIKRNNKQKSINYGKSIPKNRIFMNKIKSSNSLANFKLKANSVKKRNIIMGALLGVAITSLGSSIYEFNSHDTIDNMITNRIETDNMIKLNDVRGE